jgi:hypothetical protein
MFVVCLRMARFFGFLKLITVALRPIAAVIAVIAMFIGAGGIRVVSSYQVSLMLINM